MEKSPAKCSLVVALIAIPSFHAAFLDPRLAFLFLLHLGALYELGKQPSWRWAFYPALLISLACFAPQLLFFAEVFAHGAVALWLILALWPATFCATLQQLRAWHPTRPWKVAIAAPILWTGFEYVRCEAYHLKFSWMTPGFAFAGHPQSHWILAGGVYMTGFVLMGCVGARELLSIRAGKCWMVGTLVILAALGLEIDLPTRDQAIGGIQVHVAGIQMEFEEPDKVLKGLDKVLDQHPNADLIVLSEYSFDGPVPEEIRDWCRRRGKHLIAGGKDTAPTEFYNTAFVIGPTGNVEFKQVKSVPIQFFKDGLPAPAQSLWNSPWGKIGICICYDLNYRRVVDRLVKLGAQAIICPTMDVASWGKQQHVHHARTAPLRSSELGIPILKVASSGFSQLVTRSGSVAAMAGFPGEGEILGGTLNLEKPGRIPLDHWLGPGAAVGSVLLILSRMIFGRSRPDPA